MYKIFINTLLQYVSFVDFTGYGYGWHFNLLAVKLRDCCVTLIYFSVMHVFSFLIIRYSMTVLYLIHNVKTAIFRDMFYAVCMISVL